MNDILNTNGNNRDLCSMCTHRNVCKYTEMMTKVQTAVNEVDVVIGSDSNCTAYKKIYDIDFIKPVNVDCKYFVRVSITR